MIGGEVLCGVERRGWGGGESVRDGFTDGFWTGDWGKKREGGERVSDGRSGGFP